MVMFKLTAKQQFIKSLFLNYTWRFCVCTLHFWGKCLKEIPQICLIFGNIWTSRLILLCLIVYQFTLFLQTDNTSWRCFYLHVLYLHFISVTPKQKHRCGIATGEFKKFMKLKFEKRICQIFSERGQVRWFLF